MNGQWIFLSLLAAAMIFYLVTEGILGAKKRRKRLRASFGAVPHSEYRRASVARYWEEQHMSSPSTGDVDDLTWGDLDLDAVFERVNACHTLIGEEYLYALLHRPAAEEVSQARETLMAELEDETFRLRIQTALVRLGKRIGVELPTVLFHAGEFALDAPWRFVCCALLPFAPLFFLWAAPTLVTAAVALALANNVRLYLKTQKLLEGWLETLSYLLASLRCARALQRMLAGRCPALAAQLGEAQQMERRLGAGASLLSISPQSDLYMLAQLFGMLTLIPLLQYQRTICRLKSAEQELGRFFELLGEIDTAVSVLSYRHSLRVFTRPQFTAALHVRARDMLHPLLTEEENGVPNDLDLAANWLLTGSNASGKSTFIKAVAINNILAQSIGTCTAEQYELKRAPVVTSMAVRDDLAAGESYFVAEIRSMRRLVELLESGTSFYCFVDEVLKGTNTTERIASSCAVLRYLCAPGCLCIAATHDLELTQLLAGEYENHHFSEQVSRQGVCFDYRLKDGPCRTRNAIRLLEQYQFPAAIVAEAQVLVEKNEPEGDVPRAVGSMEQRKEGDGK